MDIAFGAAACFGTFVVAVLAMIVLGIRDYHYNRAYQESRPLEDRIRDFKEGAAKMVESFERVAAREPPPGMNTDWIRPTIQLYQRMEQIAGSPSSTSDDAIALARDARQFEREHRLKHQFVGLEAERLAALLERRKKSPV
jgi:hypothetical protein